MAITVAEVVGDFDNLQSLPYTGPSGGAAAGVMALVGAIWGVVYQTIVEDEVGLIYYRGDGLWIPKSTGTGNDIALGVKLFLNTTTKVVSDTDGGSDIYVGISKLAATTAATVVYVDYDAKLSL